MGRRRFAKGGGALFRGLSLVAAAAPAAAADTLIANYDDAFAFSGSDSTYAVKDSGTPANDVSGGDLTSILSNATTSPKLCLQSDGTFSWSPHNFINNNDTVTLAGSWSAPTLTSGAGSGASWIYKGYVLTINSKQVAITVELDRVNHDFIFVDFESFNSGGYVSQVFNINSGTVQESANSSSTLESASITTNGDTGYYCTMIVNHSNPGQCGVHIGFANADTGNTFDAWGRVTRTNAGTEQVDILNCNAAAGSETFGFTNTNTVGQIFKPAPSYDPVESNSGLYIEPSLTNDVIYSHALNDASWIINSTGLTATENATGNPIPGANIYTTITAASGSNRHAMYQNNGDTSTFATIVAVVKAGTATHFSMRAGDINDTSRWFAANFKFSTGAFSHTEAGAGGTFGTTGVMALADDWYLIWMTGTTSVGNVDFSGLNIANADDPGYTNYGDIAAWTESGETVDVAHFGKYSLAQGLPTLIPTFGAAVTRDNDEVTWPSINTTTPISGTCTVYVQFKNIRFRGGLYETFFDVSDTTLNNRIVFYRHASGFFQTDIKASGSGVFTSNIGTPVNNAVRRVGMRSKLNDFVVDMDGETANTDTLGAVPATPTEWQIGNNNQQTQSIWGYVYEGIVVMDAQTNDDVNTWVEQ